MSNALAESLLQPWEGPAILLVDLDAFFASVEQLDHPGWRGKPVIVGGDADKHGVVSTASYEARAFGVHSAQPALVARRLCPDAIWTHGHFDRYREMSETIMSILRDETPLVQQVSIDEAFVDVSLTKVNTEHPVRIAERIRSALHARWAWARRRRSRKSPPTWTSRVGLLSFTQDVNRDFSRLCPCGR